ncbi:hypothetical protein HHK36_025341 [Tetracentron sinense]|uniref:Phototropic-responsive NPH3 family protein n=1 Tax=Tetracentron sinense TaxID=13715 RepID=A0A834YK97_TETSI|nr:hypothetical protein HHK36_025341 [Tetracentron sinense]
MAIRESTKSYWFSKFTSPSDVCLHVHGTPLSLNRKLMVARSAKLSILLKENHHEENSYSLPDTPADLRTFELAAGFCYGYELNLSADNVVPLACLAYYLGMTENHSPNNLLKRTLTFFKQRVLPGWNESVKAFRTTENVLQQAVHLGLVNACLDSITRKVMADPRLLGTPIENMSHYDESEDNDNGYRRNSRRRRLFVLDCSQSEDLTMLTLGLYEPIMSSLIQCGVRSEYVVSSLFRYAKKWICTGTKGEGEGTVSVSKKSSRREVIEAVERLLPDDQRGLLPCNFLFEMLRSAIALQASSDCINRFEIRIGKKLNEATVEDLLILSQGHASWETKYDADCVRRIFQNFYANYTSPDISGINVVGELIDNFLAEVASDADLKRETFILLAEMSVATLLGTQRTFDGIYRAIDVYLNNHRYLTESEREEVCQVLDCHKLSPAACEHAAQNDRLPLRVVLQVLFAGQLKLRDTIPSSEGQLGFDDGYLRKEEKVGGGEEELMRIEMERIGSRVMELERECCIMKSELIEKDGGGHGGRVKKEKGDSTWRELKRKFGCISSNSMQDCNRHVKKKVHPRNREIIRMVVDSESITVSGKIGILFALIVVVYLLHLYSKSFRCMPILIFHPKDGKDILDCSVCLCQVSDGEKVRLLPKCNHAFHVVPIPFNLPSLQISGPSISSTSTQSPFAHSLSFSEYC